MAYAKSSVMDAQSFQFETTLMPLRESKANLGPFRATQIYNELIEHMKSKVELKRRRYKMRRYDNCFTGIDAVDVVMHYLLSDKETFSSDLSREKAVKVCQMLMSKRVFEPVGCRQGDSSKFTFEDSGGKLYCFLTETNEESEPPFDDSDDDSLYDDSDLAHCSRIDSNRLSYPLEAASRDDAPYREADCGSPSSRSSHSHSSSSSSMISYSDFSSSDDIGNLSKEMVEETWKEVALAQLTVIIDLVFLDGVLAPEKPSKRQQLHHNLIISNIVAKNWHLPITQSLINLAEAGLEEDCSSVLQTAIACIECLPKGASILSDHCFLRNDSTSKRRVFEILHKYYSSLGETVLPSRFFDLHMAILNLLLMEQNRQALQALRLDMVLLPLPVKEELQRLLRFMTAVALDDTLVLEPEDSNEVIVLRAFSNCIFRHKLLNPNLSSVLVQFMMQNLEKVFTVPHSLKEKVVHRLYQMRSGQNVPDCDMTYCQRISKDEYVRQAKDCTQEALIAMINSTLDDTKLSLKEKKQRLKQFQKYYPTLYQEHFLGML